MHEVYKIYQASKEYELWPIVEEKFLNILYGKNDLNNRTQVFIEKKENDIVGFISVKSKIIERSLKGSIVFLFVSEKYRKHGFGRKLLKKGIEWFQKQNIKSIKFGGATGSYFWPAVPENLLELRQFLEHEHFEISEGPVDMFANITEFHAPQGIYDSIKKKSIVIEYANPKYTQKILSLTKKHFPRWHEYYETDLLDGKFEKVFFAHKDDEIIAVSTLWIGDSNWDFLFEHNVGGGGALGVDEKWRGHGIGLAMKSWGTEILQEKGIKYVWISWTSSIGFYEKLGFRIWRKYNNARLKI